MMKSVILLASVFSMATSFADLAERKPEWLHINAGAEALSAYQLYGAMFNDEPCYIYTTSVDFDIPYLGTLGGGTWTLSDFTKRCDAFHSRWNNETDYDIHLYKDFELTEGWVLNCYVGYVWMVMYHSRYNAPTQRSGIWGFELDNPYITPFVSFEYQHAYDASLYTESGVKRQLVITDKFSITPSVSVSTMGSRFKRSFFPEYDKEYSNGIEAFFARLKAEWQATDYMNLYAQVCYFSILDSDIRDAIRSCGDTTYKTDSATIEIGISLAF